MTAILNGQELSPEMLSAWAAAEGMTWPSDDELDAAMLMLPETRPGECIPCTPVVPLLVVQLVAKASERALDEQIQALDRLAAKCDALVWPWFMGR